MGEICLYPASCALCLFFRFTLCCCCPSPCYFSPPASLLLLRLCLWLVAAALSVPPPPPLSFFVFLCLQPSRSSQISLSHQRTIKPAPPLCVTSCFGCASRRSVLFSFFFSFWWRALCGDLSSVVCCCVVRSSWRRWGGRPLPWVVFLCPVWTCTQEQVASSCTEEQRPACCSLPPPLLVEPMVWLGYVLMGGSARAFLRVINRRLSHARVTHRRLSRPHGQGTCLCRRMARGKNSSVVVSDVCAR